MMMAFGTFVFSLSDLAYQQLQRQMSWRHASSERVGARAARQFLGPGEDSIELSGLILPPLTGDVASLETLRDMAGQGAAQALVDGSGNVYGQFAIESLRETQTLHFPDGTPRRIEFQLTLTRYEDGDGSTGALEGWT